MGAGKPLGRPTVRLQPALTVGEPEERVIRGDAAPLPGLGDGAEGKVLHGVPETGHRGEAGDPGTDIGGEGVLATVKAVGERACVLGRREEGEADHTPNEGVQARR